MFGARDFQPVTFVNSVTNLANIALGQEVFLNDAGIIERPATGDTSTGIKFINNFDGIHPALSQQLTDPTGTKLFCRSTFRLTRCHPHHRICSHLYRKCWCGLSKTLRPTPCFQAHANTPLPSISQMSLRRHVFFPTKSGRPLSSNDEQGATSVSCP